jgi:type III secretion system FlhB-like substrate exporter
MDNLKASKLEVQKDKSDSTSIESCAVSVGTCIDAPAIPVSNAGIIQEEKDKEIEQAIVATANDSETHIDQDEILIPLDDSNVDDTIPTNLTKSQALKLRLRTLQQKMNQARQLNRQAVKDEGARLTSDGQAREKKRQQMADKQSEQAALESRHAPAHAKARELDVDPKYLTEQAATSVRHARLQAETRERNQHSVHDYHNPQGQHRNYERSLRSLPRTNGDTMSDTSTFTLLDSSVSGVAADDAEREGARRLARELQRRNEKKRARVQADTGQHINKRNQMFNNKIERQYDASTAELQQNLERGTAL